MPKQKESGRHLLVPQNVPPQKPTLAKPKALQIVISYSKILSQSHVMMNLLSGYCVALNLQPNYLKILKFYIITEH